MRNLSVLARCWIGILLVALAVPAWGQTSAFQWDTRYDAMGRVTGTIAPDPDGAGVLPFPAVRNSYDSAGRLTATEEGSLIAWQNAAIAPSTWSGFTVNVRTEYSYDAQGKRTLERRRGSDGVATAVTQYSYDTYDRLQCTAVRMNPAVWSALPASACILGTEGTGGPDRIERRSYDTSDRVLLIQNAVGTALAVDDRTNTYTADGELASIRDGNGNLAQFAYDGHGRQIRWTFPSPTTAGAVNAADYEQYGYDPNGNRTSLRRRDGQTLTFQYDALNRMTVKVVPERAGLAATHTRDVFYGYDLRGLQTYARYDSATGEGVTNNWDGFGRQVSTTLTMDGSTRTLSFARNRNGARTKLTWMDGQATSYGYDGLDRLTNVYEGAVGSTVSMAIFTYDNRGQVSSQTGRYGQTQTVGYDPVSRPTSLTLDIAGTAQDQTVTLGYNPASQIITRGQLNDAYVYGGNVNLTRSYTVNGLNQYLSAGPASFTYDANGNLTSDGSTTYVYDADNRLVSASGASNATLRYDPLGRLYETIGGGATTRYLHDGDELVAEFTGTGTLLRRYLHGLRDDDPVVWYEGAGLANPRWLHPDQQGSIVAISDSASAAFGIDRYDAWGVPDASNMGRFQYTGQAWLPELGMFYYKARIYSPTLGRFLQTDPMGYDDGTNLYAYVGNDPVNRNDPTGLAGVAFGGEVFVAVGEGDGPNSTVFGGSVSVGVSVSRNGDIQIGVVTTTSERGVGLGVGATIGPSVFRGRVESQTRNNVTVTGGYGPYSGSASARVPTDASGRPSMRNARSADLRSAAGSVGHPRLGRLGGGAAYGIAVLDTTNSRARTVTLNPLNIAREFIRQGIRDRVCNRVPGFCY